MASPSQFHDPYFGTDQSEQAPNAPLQHDEQYLSGTDITILRPRLSYELLVEGSGTIAYSSAATSSLRFTVTGGDENKPQLWLTIRPQQVLLQAIHSRFEETIPFQWLKTEFAGTLTTGTRTTYWLSIDSQTGLVRYGKHLANKAMTLYQAELTNLKWLREAHDVWVKENGDEDSHLAPVVMPLPVKTDLAPFVITADTISLRELEQGTYTVPAVLPEECRLLFQHVAAPSVVLDSEDFPDFSKAIEHSCTTPGLWAYERLKSKEQANATKDDPKCSYLRFSLGYNWNDHGAGGTRTTLILEIWPRGHSSRTRAYGSTFGIMKILHGEVMCTWYKVSVKYHQQVGSQAKLIKDQVTWFDCENYNIQKLSNESSPVCVIIQCRKGRDLRVKHEDRFNYWDRNGKETTPTHPPEDDMVFGDFYKRMKQEWQERQMGPAVRNAHS